MAQRRRAGGVGVAAVRAAPGSLTCHAICMRRNQSAASPRACPTTNPPSSSQNGSFSGHFDPAPHSPRPRRHLTSTRYCRIGTDARLMLKLTLVIQSASVHRRIRFQRLLHRRTAGAVCLARCNEGSAPYTGHTKGGPCKIRIERLLPPPGRHPGHTGKSSIDPPLRPSHAYGPRCNDMGTELRKRNPEYSS